MSKPFGIIYKLTNKTNGMSYIGQTTRTLKRRWNEHLCFAKNGTCDINKAIHEYGKDNFDKEILVECSSKIELREKEDYFVDTYNCLRPFGYNMIRNYFGSNYWPISEETRKKMSDAQKGRVCSEETRKKMSEVRKGKPKSEEWKKKISKTLMGHGFSNEAIAKMSKSRKGRQLTSETKRKMSIAKMGKTKSEETKRKMSIAKRKKMGR
jgi:group I intron endonuclease